MSFLNPIWLPILLVIPVLALIYAFAQRRRSLYAVRFTNLDLLASVVGKRPGFRRHVPTALFLLGLTGLVLAAADPVLNLVEPDVRRQTLIAQREQRGTEVVYRFDIYLQGDRETVFFDV